MAASTTGEQTVVGADLDVQVAFGGAQAIEARLTRVRAFLAANRVGRVELRLEIDTPTYRLCEQHALFGLTPQSKGPNLLEGGFSDDRPIVLTLVLGDEARGRFFGPGTADDPGPALQQTVDALVQPEGGEPLQQTEAWLYASVLQQVTGKGFEAGFANKDVSLP